MEPTTTTAAESMGENPLSMLSPDMWDMIVGMCELRDQVSMWKTCKTMGDICGRYFKGKEVSKRLEGVYLQRVNIDNWFLTFIDSRYYDERDEVNNFLKKNSGVLRWGNRVNQTTYREKEIMMYIFDNGFISPEHSTNGPIIKVHIRDENGEFGKYSVRNILGGKVEGVSETQKSQIRELYNVKMKE